MASSIAQALHGTLEQFVRPHLVHASFPVDRFFNKMAFMAVIVQAFAIMVANFAARAKISCTPDTEGDANATAAAGINSKVYAESYCYSQGVDQTSTPNHTIPSDFRGVLDHYLLQFYLPLLFLAQGVSLYLPYYAWSRTVGEHLREHIQFVVDLSLKLLDDHEETEDHHHTEACKSRRLQHGRASKADVLTDGALRQRLKRWYCKAKHTKNYYYFQACRVTLLALWLAFYCFCPGFRHRDIRYQFACVIRNRAAHRYMCVLLQASIFEVGWTSNICILAFCLVLILRQILYVFPFVVSCRCVCCRTKRCLDSCRKECRSHYFQRILGIVIKPKREAAPDGGGCCSALLGQQQQQQSPQQPDYEQLSGGTDFYSPRLVDRYYISQLCYENSHLLDKVLPDTGSANASDEFSSLGNLASIAMKLDSRADEASASLDESLRDVEGQAKTAVNPFLSKLRRVKSSAEEGLMEAESAAVGGPNQAASAAGKVLRQAESAAVNSPSEMKFTAAESSEANPASGEGHSGSG